MDGRWTEAGKPRPFPNPDGLSGGERYLRGDMSASVKLCLECGSVVWSVDIHDHFHAA